MFFYGASGHAKVVIEAWVSAGGTVSGIFDDNENITSLLSYPVLGKPDLKLIGEQSLILAIGSNAVRKKLADQYQLKYGKIIHPFTSVSPSVRIEEGTVVLAGSIINADTTIGQHTIINTGASVDHDCVIGKFVHVAPQATICGGVHVGDGTLVGAGATIIQNITIGKGVTIGAGSVIVADVPDYAVITGIPGKIKKYTDRH